MTTHATQGATRVVAKQFQARAERTCGLGRDVIGERSDVAQTLLSQLTGGFDLHL